MRFLNYNNYTNNMRRIQKCLKKSDFSFYDGCFQFPADECDLNSDAHYIRIPLTALLV